MDPTQIKKIQAMNRYKRRQFLDNLYFYSFTAIACSVFCCVTLCLPYLFSLLRVFFLVYMPNLIIPILLSSKHLFILCNLIIVVLVINSRILSSSGNSSSSTSDVYYDEYIQSKQITTKPHHQIPIPDHEVNKAVTLFEKHVGENHMDMMTGEEYGINSLELKSKAWRIKKSTETCPAAKEKEDYLDEGEEQSNLVASSDELNKRADDFIARVNRQRKIELSLLQCGSY